VGKCGWVDSVPDPIRSTVKKTRGCPRCAPGGPTTIFTNTPMKTRSWGQVSRGERAPTTPLALLGTEEKTFTELPKGQFCKKLPKVLRAQLDHQNQNIQRPSNFPGSGGGKKTNRKGRGGDPSICAVELGSHTYLSGS